MDVVLSVAAVLVPLAAAALSIWGSRVGARSSIDRLEALASLRTKLPNESMREQVDMAMAALMAKVVFREYGRKDFDKRKKKDARRRANDTLPIVAVIVLTALIAVCFASIAVFAVGTSSSSAGLQGLGATAYVLSVIGLGGIAVWLKLRELKEVSNAKAAYLERLRLHAAGDGRKTDGARGHRGRHGRRSGLPLFR